MHRTYPMHRRHRSHTQLVHLWAVKSVERRLPATHGNGPTHGPSTTHGLRTRRKRTNMSHRRLLWLLLRRLLLLLLLLLLCLLLLRLRLLLLLCL